VAVQSFINREHIIVIDDWKLDQSIRNLFIGHRQEWFSTGQRHNDFGNLARNLAWPEASGEWIIYLDCDNRLANVDTLGNIAAALEGISEPVAFFPILREGRPFFPPIPPQIATVDTANLVVRRELARWPSGPDYDMDGKFIVELAGRHACAYFPEAAPIIIMERSNHGR
jgi:glycosyltransferase involved in cell wall biosynthesis